VVEEVEGKGGAEVSWRMEVKVSETLKISMHVCTRTSRTPEQSRVTCMLNYTIRLGSREESDENVCSYVAVFST
jgi:hypothetical protein